MGVSAEYKGVKEALLRLLVAELFALLAGTLIALEEVPLVGVSTMPGGVVTPPQLAKKRIKSVAKPSLLINKALGVSVEWCGLFIGLVLFNKNRCPDCALRHKLLSPHNKTKLVLVRASIVGRCVMWHLLER